MAESIYVQYVTTTYDKLAEVDVIAGQLIAISDRDMCCYDMIDPTDLDDNNQPTNKVVRRMVSGLQVIDKFKDGPGIPGSIYVLVSKDAESGREPGIYIWNNVNDYICVANINTDENVKTSPVPSKTKLFLVGTSEEDESVGELYLNTNIYVDTSDVLHVDSIEGKINEASHSESSDSADEAVADDKGQNIAKTYIKSITLTDHTMKFTRGDGSSFTLTTPDTHYVTKLVVGNSDTSSSNAEAINGEVHINLLDNALMRDSHKISGTGSTEVTSDADGNITIHSEDTWKANSKNESGYVPAGKDNPDCVYGTDDEGNPKWIPKNNSSGGGIVSGTYTKVSVEEGIVVSGENPTTLKDYGIKDALPIVQLDSNSDLDDISEPGLYVAPNDNNIQNKPAKVNSFSLLALPSSDSYSYVVHKLFSSGEMFVPIQVLPAAVRSGVFSSGFLEIRLTSDEDYFDYPISSTKLSDKYKNYNFLDKIYVGTTNNQVYTLRDVETEVYAVDGNRLRINIDISNESILYVCMLEGAMFPSYKYTNEDSQYKTCYMLSSGTQTEVKAESTIWFDVLLIPENEIIDESNKINYKYFKYAGHFYNQEWALFQWAPENTYDFAEETGIFIRTDHPVTDVYVNGKHENVAGFTGGEDVEAAQAVVYLSALTLRYNDVRLICDNGATYQTIIVNEYGEETFPEQGNSSSDEFTRRCINGKWTDWSTNSGSLQYEDFHV